MSRIDLIDHFALSHSILVNHIQGLDNYEGHIFKDDYMDEECEDKFIEVCSDNGNICAICLSNMIIHDKMCSELVLILNGIPRLDFYMLGFESTPIWLKDIEKLEKLAFFGIENADYVSYGFIKDMQSLRKLRISNHLIELPGWLSFLTQLTSLDLNGNRLQSLPDSLGNLQQLTSLDLSDNELLSLPDSLTNLQQLTTLDLSNNELLSLPDSLGSLQQLVSIDLHSNCFQNLPGSLGNLQQLNSIDLSSNRFQNLPDLLATLQQITSLDLSSNNLLSLPESIATLQKLTSLHLRKNKFQSLPDSIGNLQHLIDLDLSDNKLQHLPDSLTKLQQLTSLDLSENRLQNLPDSFGMLQQLTSLHLNRNELQCLSNSLGNLQQLTCLGLSFNNLQSLPNSIGNLQKLTYLSLGNNKLQSLPDSLGNLQQLTSLDLRDNELLSLPDSIGNLLQLTNLYLDENKLQSLPDSIGILKKLTSLSLRGNEFQSLPGSLTNLQQLIYLDLSNNKLQSLPDSIGNLQQLTYLDLSDNKLQSLPNSMCGLHCLERLYMKRTDLYSFPDWINKFESLKSLDLRGMHLSMLDSSLLDLGVPYICHSSSPLFWGDGIALEDVILDKMDISLFSQSRQTIEAFYSDGLVETRECKVVFLGKGDVGKTSLINRIKKNGFSDKKILTRGIAITDWLPFDDCNGRIRFWDFGGQLELDIAHKCFMTPRNVYVVVFSSLEDSTIDRDAERWLDTINTFAADSKVILVINKIDLFENSSLNERALKKKYPNLMLPVIRTSACTDSGIAFLSATICDAVQKSKSFNMLFNRKWLEIKQTLEANPSKYIEDSDFQRICNHAGVPDPFLQDLILDYFRVLGVSFYYREENRLNALQDKYFVLNPNWLTNGMYRLIVHSKEGDPFISHREINRIMQEPQNDDVEAGIVYTKHETVYILTVARYFELSFETQFGGEYYEFLPMKSPKDEYDIDISFNESLHIRWSAEYIPLLVLYRLMVRKFPELHHDKVWRYGAYFTQNANPDTHAKVVMNASESTIDLHVVSNNHRAKEFLDVLRNELLQLFEKISIKAKESFIIQRDDKYGEVNFLDLLYFYERNIKFPIARFADQLDPGEVLGLYFARDTINQIAKRKFLDEGERKVEINNYYGNVAKTENQNGDIIQVMGSTFINNLPNSITAKQYSELITSLKEFLDSDEADEMTQGDVKKIKAILTEPYQTGWQKFKDFLSTSADVITISSALSLFITSHGATVAEWVKNLFLR